MSPEILIEVAQSLGMPAVLMLMLAMYMRDKGKAESKQDVSLANIATSQTVQVAEIYKDMGTLRQDLGKSEGKVEVLQDTLSAERIQWNIERKELLGRIDKLEKKQAELIHESNSKSEIIVNVQKERDAIKLELLHANNKLDSANNKIEELEAVLRSANHTDKLKTTEISIVADSPVETHISNVQTAKTADNQIKDEE